MKLQEHTYKNLYEMGIKSRNVDALSVFEALYCNGCCRKQEGNLPLV